MKTGRIIFGALIAIPFASWSYFRFIHYPVEIERHDHGGFTVVALAEPTDFRHPASLFYEVTSIPFGSIMNYTQIRVELREGEKTIGSAVLARGEDMPEDHIPLEVEWNDTTVVVAEKKRGRQATFELK